MSAIGNATIAMAYANAFRGGAARLARQRAAKANWAQFLPDEDGSIERNVLRGARHRATIDESAAEGLYPQRPEG